MTHFNQFDRSPNAGISFSSGLLKPFTLVADLCAAGNVARAARDRVPAPALFAHRAPAGRLDVRGYTPEGFTIFW